MFYFTQFNISVTDEIVIGIKKHKLRHNCNIGIIVELISPRLSSATTAATMAMT